MNLEYQLQHLDVKPQNLFLVRNRIKVADFGLAKDLEGMTASLSAGITPVYASPETFDGRVSRFSDQYSLAIVYQEMLTGKRPFNGTNARMLLMQHVKLPPDLTPLPPNERAIVERALAKDPNQRWPTCTAFVQELRALPQAATVNQELPAVPPASPPPVLAPSDAPTGPFAPQSRESAAQAPVADFPEDTHEADSNDRRADDRPGSERPDRTSERGAERRQRRLLEQKHL